MDQIIENSRFCDFLVEFFEIKKEEEIYELWLYKVQDKSFKDFKNEVDSKNQKPVSKEEAISIVNRSKEFLSKKGKI